jgi:hypothetical protein
MIAGRAFDEHDSTLGPEMPVIVDDLMARRLFGDADPLRRTFRGDPSGTGQMITMHVIGVVHHLRHRSLVDHGREQVFLPLRIWPRNPASYIVRTTGDPEALVAPMRDVVRALDAGLPVYDVRPLSHYLVTARAPSRFTMLLSLTFAGVALVLACVGVYGVIAYAASRRTREFGIRLALGAERKSIVRMVVGDGLRLAAFGVACGLAGGVLAARLLGSLLFGVTAYDPIAYLAATGTLVTASLLAAWLPARRAGAMPPMDVLRD